MMEPSDSSSRTLLGFVAKDLDIDDEHGGRNPVSLTRELREAIAIYKRKAAAHDRLVAWLNELDGAGVAGRFIAPSEIRSALKGWPPDDSSHT